MVCDGVETPVGCGNAARTAVHYQRRPAHLDDDRSTPKVVSPKAVPSTCSTQQLDRATGQAGRGKDHRFPKPCWESSKPELPFVRLRRAANSNIPNGRIWDRRRRQGKKPSAVEGPVQGGRSAKGELLVASKNTKSSSTKSKGSPRQSSVYNPRIEHGQLAPRGIWLCPSTASLREEAMANLGGRTRPGLWQTPSGVALKDAAREELVFLKERLKALKKREPRAAISTSLRAEMAEDVRERWMKRRALMRTDRYTVQQRRELRKWFDSLDKDGSGEIDSSELSHPLLSTGIARSSQEVEDLVRDRRVKKECVVGTSVDVRGGLVFMRIPVKNVDKDGSGEIGFNEFLAILQPRGPAGASPERSKMATGDAVNKIVKLQQVKKVYGGDMSTVILIERRSLLMKEILDEAAFRDDAREEMANKRYIAEREGDHRTLRALRWRERKLEMRRTKKNLFINAVSETTDFAKEHEELRAIMAESHRRDSCGGRHGSSSSSLDSPDSTD